MNIVSCNAICLVGFGLLAFLPTVHAQTHCTRDEDVEFSCKIKGSTKIASLCSGDLDSGLPGARWLQYRFGAPGKIELRYPERKEDSLQRFEGVVFSKYDYLSYHFVNGAALYEIELSEHVHMTAKDKGSLWFSGLLRVESNRKKVELQCASPVSEDYWKAMAELSSATHQYTGDGSDSLVYRFYNPERK